MNYELFSKFFFRQMYKIGIISPMLTPVMIAVNLSTSIFVFIEYRGIHPYVAIPLIFIFLLLLILSICYLLVDILQIQRSQKAAVFTYDPTTNKHLNPFQQMWWKHSYIPMMEYMITGDKTLLKEGLEKMRRWADDGFIRSSDFPRDLKKYVMSKDERI